MVLLTEEVVCPECGKPMKEGSRIGNIILYNCDCGVDGWRPPVKQQRKTTSSETTKNDEEKEEDAIE